MIQISGTDRVCGNCVHWTFDPQENQGRCAVAWRLTGWLGLDWTPAWMTCRKFQPQQKGET